MKGLSRLRAEATAGAVKKRSAQYLNETRYGCAELWIENKNARRSALLEHIQVELTAFGFVIHEPRATGLPGT
jgi:hypothetical protein